jgi:hypothetical protein
MWYMKPVSVTTNVPQARADVYEYLDVMANHEPFTNHLLHDWDYSGPERGIGSKARVRTKVANRSWPSNSRIATGAGHQPNPPELSGGRARRRPGAPSRRRA